MFTFNSPTHGRLSLEKVKEKISEFIAKDKSSQYRIIIGSDSQYAGKGIYDFVSAVIIHRVGGGGIYFWRKISERKKMSLKQRIYKEAIMSLETSEKLIDFFKKNGIPKYKVQIHVDIGSGGETRELISEVTNLILSSGYEVKVKPEAVGASKVADKYT